MVENLLKRINTQLGELETGIADYDSMAIYVSSWSVGDHLEHLFRAHLAILQRIESHMNKKAEQGKRLTLMGRILLLFGRFPKGSKNAPTLTAPKGCSESELREHLEKLRHIVDKLQQRIPELNDSQYAFPHPAFGLFTIKQWLRLIEVHTRHHQRIIKAIQSHSS